MLKYMPIILFQHSHKTPQLFPINQPIMLVRIIYDSRTIIHNIQFNACYIVTLKLFQYNLEVLDPGGHQTKSVAERILSQQMLRMAEYTEPFLHRMPRLGGYSLYSSTRLVHHTVMLGLV